MIKEFEFLKIINNTLSKNARLGDDCAYLEDLGIVVSTDALVEDVHFSLKYMNPSEIASKALLVNISDILASGAEPKYALIALSGNLDNDFIKEFYTGINQIAKDYGLEIIGGDLTKGEKITIAITVIGKTKNRNISSRKNAKIGYIVAAAGEFGSSAKGLEELKQGFKGDFEEDYFIKYHKSPILYPKISSQIAKNCAKPYAMMDSSDGLIDCIYQISSKSKVKININYDLIPKKTDNKDFVLYGGEDYSLVVALEEDDFKKIKGLVQIGTCQAGEGIYLNDKKIEYKGFNHFE